MKVNFKVEGKPPKKDGSQSLWSGKSNQAPLVFELRKKALKAKKEAKMNECFQGLVRIEIKIYSPHITTNDYHQHVGDLDNLVAGIFEAIQPASKNETLMYHPIFDEIPEIAPSIPLLIDDDSKIVSINAEKIKSELAFYTVKIEPTEN